MIWFVKHIGIGDSGVISSWCIVEAVSELREWISLLEYVTWQHKTNLNGCCYDYWVSKGWSTTWFIENIGIGGSGVISLLCMVETVGESRWHMSLLEHVTWWHKTSLNGYHYDYWVSKGWSMVWFVKHIGIGGSGVISSRCIVEAVSELREWISLLKYVTWQPKTNLNGCCYDNGVSQGWSTTWFIEIIGIGGSGVISLLCMAETVGESRWHMSLLEYVTWWHKTSLNGYHYDYWGSKGWSMIWFLEHMELAAPEWFPSGASWRPSVNCVNEYPYSSMWPDNTKPTWMDVVMNNKSAIGGQLLVSWSRLELGAPEWFPRGALHPEAVFQRKAKLMEPTRNRGESLASRK